MNSSIWPENHSENFFFCEPFSTITHKGVLLCPCSIFRMFSADRKRVETALENCNLPSGRVRHQNTEAPSFFSVNAFSCLLCHLCALFYASFLILVSKLFHLLHPSIHPSIRLSSRHSAHSFSPWNSSWLPLCSFVWSLIFWMSPWLPTQNWFSLSCDETNRPSGSKRDDKSGVIFTSFRYH